MKIKYIGMVGTVIGEGVGYYLVDFGNQPPVRLLKGIPSMKIIEQKRGRPRSFGSNAEKQRAYRERQKGKALRKYEKRSS